MNKLASMTPLLAVFALAGGILAGPTPAVAGLNITDVEVSLSEIGGYGGSVTVNSNGTVWVKVTANSDSGTDWVCSDWEFNDPDTTSGEESAPDADIEGPFGNTAVTFSITAPELVGTHDLDVSVRPNWVGNPKMCTGGSVTSTLDDAVTVTSTTGLSLNLTKTLVSGPQTSSEAGTDPLASSAFAGGYLKGTNDAGVIGLNLEHSQHYAVRIKITNNGADNEWDDAVVIDTFGADIDLDPIAEEDWQNDALLNGVCSDGEADFVCNGTTNLTLNDGWLIEAASTGTCLVTDTQPPSGDGIGLTKEPEFIDIQIDTLLTGEFCSVLVFVQTVENPGANPFWEPTGCRILEYTTFSGGLIQDTFTLNEGLKAFDGITGERLVGPIGSLQLTCNEPAI